MNMTFQKIGKPHNVKVIGSKQAKENKEDNKNLLRLAMPWEIGLRFDKLHYLGTVIFKQRYI
jgi:hypothetical protein